LLIRVCAGQPSAVYSMELSVTNDVVESSNSESTVPESEFESESFASESDIDTIDLLKVYGINIEPRPTTCIDSGRLHLRMLTAVLLLLLLLHECLFQGQGRMSILAFTMIRFPTKLHQFLLSRFRYFVRTDRRMRTGTHAHTDVAKDITCSRLAGAQVKTQAPVFWPCYSSRSFV